MRKITKQAVAAFNSTTNFKLSNTEVSVTDNITSLLLHGHEIATKDATTGKLTISACGWRTSTTKERLNGIDGVSIQQVKGEWYLNGDLWNGDSIVVSEGRTVQPDILTQVVTPDYDAMIQTAITCGRIMYSKDGTQAHGSCRKFLTETTREECRKWGVTGLLPLFYAETSADYVELIYDEVDTFTLVAYTYPSK